VGKSSLTSKAVDGTFEDTYRATVGFEFFTINYLINNKIIKLQIWDTCGQEIYRSLISNFYRSSSLALIVYSIDRYFYFDYYLIEFSLDSFNQLDVWLSELRHFSNPDIKIFLIGNKSDLDDKREVPFEKGLRFKEEHKLDLFIETSAKSGFNIDELFEKAAILLYKEYMKYKSLYNSSFTASAFDSSETKNSSNSFKLKNSNVNSIKDYKESEDPQNKKLNCWC
jgi:small GTP-binding protein